MRKLLFVLGWLAAVAAGMVACGAASGGDGDGAPSGVATTSAATVMPIAP